MLWKNPCKKCITLPCCSKICKDFMLYSNTTLNIIQIFIIGLITIPLFLIIIKTPYLWIKIVIIASYIIAYCIVLTNHRIIDWKVMHTYQKIITLFLAPIVDISGFILEIFSNNIDKFLIRFNPKMEEDYHEHRN